MALHFSWIYSTIFYKVTKLHKPSLERNRQRCINNIASFKSVQETVKSLIGVHRLKIYNSPKEKELNPPWEETALTGAVCGSQILAPPHPREEASLYNHLNICFTSVLHVRMHVERIESTQLKSAEEQSLQFCSILAQNFL